MNVGWLDNLTEWLQQRLQEFIDFIVAALSEMLLGFVVIVLDGFAWLLEQIPVPAWVQTYSLGGLLGEAGPWMHFLAVQMNFVECFGVIALGWGFRLVRKALTLGQW